MSTDFILVGLNENERPCAAVTVRAASAGIEIVKANGVSMLHDLGHKHVSRVEVFAWPITARIAELERDKARLDWLNEHRASVEVNDEEILACAVVASDDMFAAGKSDPYDIRAAIDAAIAEGKP